MPSEREQRRAPRVQPFVAPCRLVHGSRRCNGYLMDLSSQGARVSCEGEPLEAGTDVVVEVKLGRKLSHTRLPAHIVWSRTEPPAFVIGITFLEMSPQEKGELDAVLEEFRRRAAQLN